MGKLTWHKFSEEELSIFDGHLAWSGKMPSQPTNDGQPAQEKTQPHSEDPSSDTQTGSTPKPTS